MTDQIPSFETEDNLGTTDWIVGSAGVFGNVVPNSSGNSIEEFCIRCRIDQDSDLRLEVSIDKVNWFLLCPGDSFCEEPRGKNIKQIFVRSTSSTQVRYELALNRGVN